MTMQNEVITEIDSQIISTSSAYTLSGDYKDKVAACWEGKAIAGGIGAPYEGVPEPLSLTQDDIYIQPGPNDDLELQLLWLFYAEKHGLDINAEILSDGWLNHVKYGMDEYGVAIWNLRKGLKPPFTGIVNNWFVNGLGATIRSEIWACLFPGQPQIAGYYAQQDAIVDHHGDGVWAEIFLSAAESMAFVTSDVREALEEGLKYISADSKIYDVVRYAFELYDNDCPQSELRQAIMAHAGSHNFTDCIMNIGFIVAALLYGQGDFIKTVLMAINFGKDTDCTAATCGAFMGIALGTDVLPESLRDNLDPNVAISPHVGIKDKLPKTFDELTARTISLANVLNADSQKFPSDVSEIYKPVEPAAIPQQSLNSWVVIDNPDEYDIAQISSDFMEERSCPKYLKNKIVEVDGINIDLSDKVEKFNTVHLLSFLTIEEACENPLIMACANSGITLWIDGKQVLNYHGRQQEIPAFHRVEGGASFYFPFEPQRKYLIHARLLNCRKPLRFSLAVSDTDYQFLKEFNLKV